MLISKEVKVRWNANTIKWYIEKGYQFTKYGDYFDCKIEDLQKSSSVLIKLKCDYCGKLFERKYKDYNRKKSVINKDCCAKCQPLKAKECNIINYGVENTSKLESVKNKIKNTTFEKYGVYHTSQSEQFSKKFKETMMRKYGVENPMQLEENKTKARNTFIERYGEELWHNEKIIKKTEETNIKKYGVKYCMQNEEILSKSKNTFYKNGTIATSKQQLYLHKIFGGELNYPVSKVNLDIAFPNEKFYIEFNGSGHDLSRKMGEISDEDWIKKEIKRYTYLKSKGWKVFIIISPCDYLPSKEVLLNELEVAKKWLSEDGYGHSHYNMEIGSLINDKKYGKLRRIKDEDLLEVV